MRWRIFVAWFCCTAAAVFAVVTFMVPRSAEQMVRVTLPDGGEGGLRVSYPLHGWATDWQAVTISLATQSGNLAQEPYLVRARLELFGAESDPQGDVSRVVLPGENAAFSWRMRSTDPGEARGILWVYVKPQLGEEELLFGKEFTYQSLKYGLLPVTITRTLAAFILIIGLVLFFVPKKLWDHRKIDKKLPGA